MEPCYVGSIVISTTGRVHGVSFFISQVGNYESRFWQWLCGQRQDRTYWEVPSLTGLSSSWGPLCKVSVSSRLSPNLRDHESQFRRQSLGSLRLKSLRASPNLTLGFVCQNVYLGVHHLPHGMRCFPHWLTYAYQCWIFIKAIGFIMAFSMCIIVLRSFPSHLYSRLSPTFFLVHFIRKNVPLCIYLSHTHIHVCTHTHAHVCMEVSSQ